MKEEVYKYSLKWPNTYTFTKALAEALTQGYRQYFPVAVVRPSCVMPALDEPMPGWCDSIYGTNGTFIGWYYGLIRTSQIDTQVQIDTVPVDYVSNTIISVAWKTHVTRYEICLGLDLCVSSNILRHFQGRGEGRSSVQLCELYG